MCDSIIFQKIFKKAEILSPDSAKLKTLSISTFINSHIPNSSFKFQVGYGEVFCS